MRGVYRRQDHTYQGVSMAGTTAAEAVWYLLDSVLLPPSILLSTLGMISSQGIDAMALVVNGLTASCTQASLPSKLPMYVLNA